MHFFYLLDDVLVVPIFPACSDLAIVIGIVDEGSFTFPADVLLTVARQVHYHLCYGKRNVVLDFHFILQGSLPALHLVPALLVMT